MSPFAQLLKEKRPAKYPKARLSDCESGNRMRIISLLYEIDAADPNGSLACILDIWPRGQLGGGSFSAS